MKNHQETSAPKELLTELQSLVTEAETMIAGSLAESSGAALGHLRARFGAAQERMGELYATAKKKIVAGAKCTDPAIRENPYQSMAIALGVGVLAGVLVGRRSK